MQRDKIFRSENPCKFKREKNIYKFFKRNFGKYEKEYADRITLSNFVTGEDIRFGDILPISRRVASALVKRGFRKGDVFCFNTYTHSDLVYVSLATMFCGGILSPCYYAHTSDDQKILYERYGANFLLCDTTNVTEAEKIINEVSSIRCIFIIGDKSHNSFECFNILKKEESHDSFDDLTFDDDDIIFQVLSGGTTSFPHKVITFTYLHFNNYLQFLEKGCFDIPPKDVDLVSLTTLSAFHLTGLIWMVFSSFLPGRNTFVSENLYNEEKFLEAVHKIKPDVICLGFIKLSFLLRCPHFEKYDVRSVKTVISLGGKLHNSTRNLISKKFVNAMNFIEPYASSETLAISSYINVCPQHSIKGSVGFLQPFVEAKIVSVESGEYLGPNQAGRLLVRSPFLMKRYKNDPESKEDIIDKDGFLKTGDIVSISEKNEIFFVERESLIINFSFEGKKIKIYPRDIEEILYRNVEITFACVVRAFDVKYEQVANVFVSLSIDSNLTKVKVHKYLQENTKYPLQLWKRIVIVEKPPISQAGKIKSRALVVEEK